MVKTPLVVVEITLALKESPSGSASFANTPVAASAVKIPPSSTAYPLSAVAIGGELAV